MEIVKTKTQTFEDFLQDTHLEDCPTVLDDDLPDAFNAWLEMDIESLIAYGDEYGKKMFKAGQDEMLRQEARRLTPSND